MDLFDADFPGEVPESAPYLVTKVRAALNVRFPNADSRPKLVFTDRGRGFFEPNSGRITRGYKEALAENDLRPFMGVCARTQPGNMQDLLLHETAVSWLRFQLGEEAPEEVFGRESGRLWTASEAVLRGNEPGMRRRRALPWAAEADEEVAGGGG